VYTCIKLLDFGDGSLKAETLLVRLIEGILYVNERVSRKFFLKQRFTTGKETSALAPRG
jgi:hypothetical protein